MTEGEQSYLREVQYRFPDKLKARSVLHTRYGRGDWFEWLSANIRFVAGTTIADVGCGAGSFWTNAPETVPNDLKLRLFDLSPGMVDAARMSVASMERWKNVEITVADAEALPLASASVDTTIAIHMLYHLANPSAGLSEMARVTRPGGMVAVVLNPVGTMAELSNLVRSAIDRPSRPLAEPLSSEQGLALMRRQFAYVDMLRYDDELRVTDPVDLLGYLASMPYAEAPGAMHKLTAAVGKAFRENDVFTIAKKSDLLLGRV